MDSDHLLQEFPPVSTELWEEVIRRDLKGADYAKKLIWQTAEGLAVKPYYRAEDIAGLEFPDAAPGAFPYARSARLTGDWRIREEIDAADPEEANRAAHSAVHAGAGEIAYRNARTSRMPQTWTCFLPTSKRFPCILKMPASRSFVF